MIKINLLPYREARRKQREQRFYVLMVIAAIVGAVLAAAAYGAIEAMIARQESRNEYLKIEERKLDEQLKEVATLKEEIENQVARMRAVEDLQMDHNQPVYLMDELVTQTPEGIYLKSLKQTGQKVTLIGYAHSNERVSEYLRNISNKSTWLEQPQLIEIKAGQIGTGMNAKRVFEFSMEVVIKRPRDLEAEAEKAKKKAGRKGTAAKTDSTPAPAAAGSTSSN